MARGESLTQREIEALALAIEKLEADNFELHALLPNAEDLGTIGRALLRLSATLERRYRECHHLGRLSSITTSSAMLDEVLEGIYRDFKLIIPYQRIGCSLLSEDGEQVISRWVKSEATSVYLKEGFRAALPGSSLVQIMKTGKPRIINDLQAYAELHPSSISTKLIVSEGLNSSLTCPLMASGTPIGFLFFSSFSANTYEAKHSAAYERIAEQVSIIIEKSRMVTEISRLNRTLEAQQAENLLLRNALAKFLEIPEGQELPLADLKTRLNLL